MKNPKANGEIEFDCNFDFGFDIKKLHVWC